MNIFGVKYFFWPPEVEFWHIPSANETAATPFAALSKPDPPQARARKNGGPALGAFSSQSDWHVLSRRALTWFPLTTASRCPPTKTLGNRWSPPPPPSPQQNKERRRQQKKVRASCWKTGLVARKVAHSRPSWVPCLPSRVSRVSHGFVFRGCGFKIARFN